MTTVLVTRPAGAGDPLVAKLEANGYRVCAVPTVVTRSISVEWPDLTQYDWIVLTSAAGVSSLPGIVGGPRWAVVGESTAGALRARGAVADFVPDEASGAALGATLPDPVGARVLLVRASLGGADLPAALRARGALVEELTVYETVEGPADSAAALLSAVSQPDLAAIVFASGSAVRGYVKLGGRTDLPAITIGPRTTAVAKEAGFKGVVEAATPNVRDLAAAVARAVPIEVRRDA
jgi:uroporphyrinogen III methyltransferase / synthase